MKSWKLDMFALQSQVQDSRKIMYLYKNLSKYHHKPREILNDPRVTNLPLIAMFQNKGRYCLPFFKIRCTANYNQTCFTFRVKEGY